MFDSTRGKILIGIAVLMLAAHALAHAQNARQTPKPLFTLEEVAAYKPKGPAECFRHICLEYNTPPRPEWAAGTAFDPKVLREYFCEADASAYAEFCKRIGLDAALLLAVPQGGYTTYLQTKVGEPYPYLVENNFDFFGEVIRECHKRGISVFGYICIGWNFKAQKDFPDEFHDSGHAIPTLNGRFADQVIEYARELLRHYPIDGLRTDILDHDTRLRTAGDKAFYKELYGEEMPEKYPSWQREQHFRLASISRFVHRFHKACKETKASVPIWHNWFNYKNVVDLRDARYVDISYEEFADPFSTLFVQGIFGADAMISGKLLQNPERRLCLALGGRAYDYFPVNKKTGLIDQELIDRELAGNGFYGVGSRWAVPPSMDWFDTDLAPFYRMVAKIEPYLTGATPAADLGVVFSEASRFRYTGWKRDAIIANCQEIVKHYLPQNRAPVFLSSFHLPERDDWRALRALLVPDMSGFEPDELQALRAYARGGGNLVLSGAATLYDPEGAQREDFALGRAMGLKFERILPGKAVALEGWLWRNTNMEGGSVALEVDSPGTRTLNLWMREANVCIDRIVLTAEPGYHPEAKASGSKPIEIEAEDIQKRTAAHAERSWLCASDYAGFEGSGYVVSSGPPHMEPTGCSAASAEMALEVDFPKAGRYALWVRFYAKDGSSDSLFAGLDGKEQAIVDLDAVGRHRHSAAQESQGDFRVAASEAWRSAEFPESVASRSLVAARSIRGETPVTFSVGEQRYPLVHTRKMGKGSVTYLAAVDSADLLTTVVDRVAGPSPIVTEPPEKRAYLTWQKKEKRWILHLMSAGDCAVTLHRSIATPARIVAQYPPEGWSATLESAPDGVRLVVRGEATDRLLALQ